VCRGRVRKFGMTSRRPMDCAGRCSRPSKFATRYTRVWYFSTWFVLLFGPRSRFAHTSTTSWADPFVHLSVCDIHRRLGPKSSETESSIVARCTHRAIQPHLRSIRSCLAVMAKARRSVLIRTTFEATYTCYVF
jgi:hypothetical protein